MNARWAFCPPHTPPAALSHQSSAGFFNSLKDSGQQQFSAAAQNLFSSCCSMVQPMQSAPHPAPLPSRGQWLIHAQLFQYFAGGLLQHGNALFVLLWQHRTIWQEHSAKDFASYESYKRAGILYVFPPFITARMGQKIGRRPQTQLCGDAYICYTRKCSRITGLAGVKSCGFLDDYSDRIAPDFDLIPYSSSPVDEGTAHKY